jgi:hypothetical protein
MVFFVFVFSLPGPNHAFESKKQKKLWSATHIHIFVFCTWAGARVYGNSCRWINLLAILRRIPVVYFGLYSLFVLSLPGPNHAFEFEIKKQKKTMIRNTIYIHIFIYRTWLGRKIVPYYTVPWLMSLNQLAGNLKTHREFWIVFFDCIVSLPGPNHAGIVCDGADPVHYPVLRLQRQVLYGDDNLWRKC